MDATFNQRRALFNMYSALKKPNSEIAKIRKMQFHEASEAIFNAKKEIELKGFPVPEEEE
jgi:hypothetical protein